MIRLDVYVYTRDVCMREREKDRERERERERVICRVSEACMHVACVCTHSTLG